MLYTALCAYNSVFRLTSFIDGLPVIPSYVSTCKKLDLGPKFNNPEGKAETACTEKYPVSAKSLTPSNSVEYRRNSIANQENEMMGYACGYPLVCLLRRSEFPVLEIVIVGGNYMSWRVMIASGYPLSTFSRQQHFLEVTELNGYVIWTQMLISVCMLEPESDVPWRESIRRAKFLWLVWNLVLEPRRQASRTARALILHHFITAASKIQTRTCLFSLAHAHALTKASF